MKTVRKTYLRTIAVLSALAGLALTGGAGFTLDGYIGRR
jgi:hypothetical protein